jgi:hypothetical protein
MTTAQAKAELKDAGIIIRRETGGFRVNVAGGCAATSCLCPDLQEALDLGEAMAVINRSYTFSIPTR